MSILRISFFQIYTIKRGCTQKHWLQLFNFNIKTDKPIHNTQIYDILKTVCELKVSERLTLVKLVKTLQNTNFPSEKKCLQLYSIQVSGQYLTIFTI